MGSANWDANLYQSAHAFVWQQAADLIDLLDPKRGERVLDLGCGTGQLTAQIRQRGADVIGIDRSEAMVAQARQNFPDIPFDQDDATTFTLGRPVDAVFSNATLHWVKPPEAAVARVWAALKPGGRFVAEFGGKGNVARVCDALRGALHEVAGIEFEKINPWFFPGIAEYAALLEQQGFEVTFAMLFDRPTPLEGGDVGLANWARMFGASLLEQVDAAKRADVVAVACERARGELFRDGTWFADYRRLRIVAKRPI